MSLCTLVRPLLLRLHLESSESLAWKKDGEGCCRPTDRGETAVRFKGDPKRGGITVPINGNEGENRFHSSYSVDLWSKLFYKSTFES